MLPVQRARRGDDPRARRAALADRSVTVATCRSAGASANCLTRRFTQLSGAGPGLRGTLEKLRPEPGGLLPKDGSKITGFRLSLSKSVGGTRGNAESGFIRSVDAAVERFRSTVVARLDQRPARRPASWALAGVRPGWV